MMYGNLNYDMHGRKRKRKVIARHGRYKTTFKEAPAPEGPVRRDEGVQYKSADDGSMNTGIVERKKYTGTLIAGVATMHKSNAVPIINEQEAIDIARMRRG